jgi:hypothetical protein
MTDFKVGDRVRRVRMGRLHGACIGTIATVTRADEDGYGYISVYYPGCCDERDGSEIWDARFAELVQEPQHENEKDKEKPVNTVTLLYSYLTMQEACGIKEGDTVRVLRKAMDGEMGWTSSWVSPFMDAFIGVTGVVKEYSGSAGFRVSFSDDGLGWWFPFFVLEKIADAPRLITINGFEVPEPVREPLKMGERYWVASVTPDCSLCLACTWTCDGFDRLWLRRGLIHLTPEAAKKHAKALLSFTREEERSDD